MTSISRSRQLPESRSGGKILRSRRTTSAKPKTPYQRPSPPNSAPQSSSWLSRFVFSSTRSIATGAGKLFLSAFDLQSSPTYSSSSSSGGGSIAEEVGTLNDENNTPFQGNDVLKKSGALEVINFSPKGFQPLVRSSKSKHVIGQLLVQETFSREECDRLIKIIKSRVVDSPANEVEETKRSSEMLNRTLGSGTPVLCSAAAMEAMKWLKEKTGLGSKSDLGYGSHSLDLATLPPDLEDEGSPVDVAKSYMRARPPWASPSIDQISPQTSIGIQFFKEETPYLFSRNSIISPKLKRVSPATGSWSIQDEIRRVRFRVTEQMLMTPPSTKIDWCAFAVKHTDNVNSTTVENTEASMGEKVHNVTGSVDASSNLTGGISMQAPLDMKRKWDGLQSEAVLTYPINISFEQNLASKAIQQTEGSQDDWRNISTSGQKLRSADDIIVQSDGDMVKVDGLDIPKGTNHQLNSLEETREASDPKLHDGSCSVSKEKVGAEDGSPSSGPCFHAGQVIEQTNKTSDDKLSTADLDHERTEKGALEQDTCERLSETFLDLPDLNLSDIVTINEDDGIATVSQNTSSLQLEVQHDNSRPDLAAPTSSIAKQQQAQRITRYNRRARSRGVK